MTYLDICRKIDSLYAAGDRGDALFGAIRQLAMYRLDDEDASQEAVIDVLTYIQDFRGIGPFHAWVNRCVTRRHHRLVTEAMNARLGGEPGVEMPFNATRFSPDFGAIDNPFVRRVAELISQGYQQKEIAVMLEIPITTLWKRLHDYRQRRVVTMPVPAELRKAA